MPPTIGYRFGDVVLVPFPFTDQTGAMKRLVLRKLGRLQDADRKALQNGLGLILG